MISDGPDNRVYEDGEYEFHQWMGKYWSGVKLEWYADAKEYRGSVQIAWEIWKRFLPKNLNNVKIWSMFQGGRFVDGLLQESYNHNPFRSDLPGKQMVDLDDYHKLVAAYQIACSERDALQDKWNDVNSENRYK